MRKLKRIKKKAKVKMKRLIPKHPRNYLIKLLNLLLQLPIFPTEIFREISELLEEAHKVTRGWTYTLDLHPEDTDPREELNKKIREGTVRKQARVARMIKKLKKYRKSKERLRRMVH